MRQKRLKNQAETQLTTAVGPPKPVAMARLRRIRAFAASRFSRMRRVGSGLRVCTLGGIMPLPMGSAC